MVKMRMGQQQKIDRRPVKTEFIRILLGQLAPTLVHTAVNQYALACAIQQMAGSGDALAGAVK